MPRYFFDVCDEDGWHRDDCGIELDTFEEAREQAISILPDIARDELPDGDSHVIFCAVRNASDRVIYRGELCFRGTRVGNPDPR